jgi:aminoglycoside phosphotransferase (APT) family kinase protein
MEDKFIFGQLTKALHEKLNLRVLSATLFDCGSHCNIYKVTTEATDGTTISLVARLPRTDKQSRRTGMYREHVVLRYLESVGYRYAPKSYLYDATLKYLPVPYSIQSFIAATPLALNSEMTKKLAYIIRDLHSIDIEGLYEYGFSFYRTWHEGFRVEIQHLGEWLHSSFSPPRETNSWFLQIKPILLEAWSIIRKTFEHSKYNSDDGEIVNPSLLHGDLGGHNFAWVNGNPYLFDWELTSIGDPALDLAKLFRSELRDPALKYQFLLAYQAGVSNALQHNFAERLELYERIAALQTAIWALNILVNNPDLQIYLTRNHFNKLGFVEFNVYHNLAYIDSALAEQARGILTSSDGKNNSA